MIDTREAIIEHLATLLGGISGITNVFRDRADLKDSMCPAAIILDGRETRLSQVTPNKFVKMPPVLMQLIPEIFIQLRKRDKLDNQYLDGVFNPVGPELSTYRMHVLAAIINDPALIDLLGGPRCNGQILYNGCDTDMQSVGSIGAFGAQLQMHFEFLYILIPPQA